MGVPERRVGGDGLLEQFAGAGLLFGGDGLGRLGKEVLGLGGPDGQFLVLHLLTAAVRPIRIGTLSIRGV